MVPSVLDHRDTPAWRLLVEAAVVRSFLPHDLAPDVARGDERRQAEGVLLSFSEITYGPEGARWSLTQQARAEVIEGKRTRDKMIEGARDRGELITAIERTAKVFRDIVSQALREYLKRLDSESDPVPDQAPSRIRSREGLGGWEWLEAMRSAVSLLSGLATSRKLRPPLDELDRRIGFRRLLGQFEQMVESRPREGGPAEASTSSAQSGRWKPCASTST